MLHRQLPALDSCALCYDDGTLLDKWKTHDSHPVMACETLLDRIVKITMRYLQWSELEVDLKRKRQKLK